MSVDENSSLENTVNNIMINRGEIERLVLDQPKIFVSGFAKIIAEKKTRQEKEDIIDALADNLSPHAIKVLSCGLAVVAKPKEAVSPAPTTEGFILDVLVGRDRKKTRPVSLPHATLTL